MASLVDKFFHRAKEPLGHRAKELLGRHSSLIGREIRATLAFVVADQPNHIDDSKLADSCNYGK